MNAKKIERTKRSARTAPQKLHIEKGAQGLTTQAGLIPVTQFLRKHQLSSLIGKTLQHERGASALTDAALARSEACFAVKNISENLRDHYKKWRRFYLD